MVLSNQILLSSRPPRPIPEVLDLALLSAPPDIPRMSTVPNPLRQAITDDDNKDDDDDDADVQTLSYSTTGREDR